MISWWSQLETKLEVHHSILNRDVHFRFASFTGPNLHDFMDGVEEERLLMNGIAKLVFILLVLGLISRQKSHMSHGRLSEVAKRKNS